VKSWRLLIELVRPPFLIFTLWVLLAGFITTSGFSFSVIPQMIAFTVLGHLAIFSLNDYFDRDSDQVNERKGSLEGAVVNGENEGFVKYTAIISNLALIVLALFLPNFSTISGLIVLAASFLYSAPPFRLKEKPIVDSLSNVIILYFTFCVGVGLAGGTLGDVIPGAFWFALIFGGTGHMAASYVDREADAKAGMKTSGIVLGRKGIALLGEALIVLALVFQEWSTESQAILVITLIFSFYPLFREENIKKVMYLWAVTCTVYIGYWLFIRL